MCLQFSICIKVRERFRSRQKFVSVPPATYYAQNSEYIARNRQIYSLPNWWIFGKISSPHSQTRTHLKLILNDKYMSFELAGYWPNEHLWARFPLCFCKRIYSPRFFLWVEDSEPPLLTLPYNIRSDFNREWGHYLCFMVWPATPHPHVHIPGEFLLPRDLVCLFYSPQDVGQLPLT